MAWILLRPSNYKQVAPLVRTGGSRHTGLAALPHRNIQPNVALLSKKVYGTLLIDGSVTQRDLSVYFR